MGGKTKIKFESLDSKYEDFLIKKISFYDSVVRDDLLKSLRIMDLIPQDEGFRI